MKRIQGCDCGKCESIRMIEGTYEPIAVRNCPLTEDELNALRRARNANPKRLAAMLPNWIKRHQESVAFPKPYVFIAGRAPIYPMWTYSKGF